MLIQTQLSNYNREGKFDLACDSGWQMVIGRARVLLDLDKSMFIDIMCPFFKDCIASPLTINLDLFEKFRSRLRVLQHDIIPNALSTRFDFNFDGLSVMLKTVNQKYDVVFLNDPMHLRNFKAMFLIGMNYVPKFVVHSHFIDNPSCPKFPIAASLWMGQVEAARRADWNFWQCESALNVFKEEISLEYKEHIVDEVMNKSTPWDDGYSSEEINSPVNLDNVRIDIERFEKNTKNKIILFVPNRIGDGKRSSDYTNCGHFMFKSLPELRRLRDDFVVICGNPNQKIPNEELESTCGQHGYLKVVPDSLNRDEFKWIARNSHIVVSLYNNDVYGGTVSRECIDLGLTPLWLDNYEYQKISKEADWKILARPDLSDVPQIASDLIDSVRNRKHSFWLSRLQHVIREKCSYEKTTINALNNIKSLL